MYSPGHIISPLEHRISIRKIDIFIIETIIPLNLHYTGVSFIR